ncbi:N(4)-(beta-N-acetylglucosaminyl)-L-asparaginase [bacterium]|nr:N(4)-(beta-N-acetylglucosaminyl)-L-asparaginase [bacterium]
MSFKSHHLVWVGLFGIASFLGNPQGDLVAAEKDALSAGAKAYPLFVSTWPFGQPANELARKTVENGGSLLDGVEAGIRLTEADFKNQSVGIGGLPNRLGVVQLDACIMSGKGHQAGAVGGIEGILHPISVARKVMENTPHVLIVGQGAQDFAVSQGFSVQNLLTSESKIAWEKWKAEQSGKLPEDSHDTIALVGLDSNGNLAGGCSTSGLAYKIPGRVGDSPLIGDGLYVDNEVGAAGATGVGENILRYSGSFLVVEYMRQGLHPQEACIKTIERIARLDPLNLDELFINFIAIDKQGRFGAAGTGEGFEYSVTYPGYSEVLKSAALSTRSVGVIGGNQPEKLK